MSRTDGRFSPLRGLFLLLLLSAGGIITLVVAAGGTESLSAFRNLSPVYIAAGLLLVVLDLFLGGLRNHIFVRTIRPGTGFMLSFRANAANMFMGAITPSQGLGGPAQLAVLKLGGVPIGAAVSVSVLNFIGTLLFFGAGVFMSLFFFHDMILSPGIRSILWACAGLFSLAFLLLLLALFKPSLIRKLIKGMVFLLGRVPFLPVKRIRRMEQVLDGKVDDYHRWCLVFLREKPGKVLASIFLTVVLYLNKFTVSWLIALGLGLDLPWKAMFSSLYLITFISYFAPSPGAGGIAEVSTGVLLSSLIPSGFLPLFTLLNRAFILFIPAGAGFLVSVGTLRAAGGLSSLSSGKNDATFHDP